jgi:hypothetical protein
MIHMPWNQPSYKGRKATKKKAKKKAKKKVAPKRKKVTKKAPAKKARKKARSKPSKAAAKKIRTLRSGAELWSYEGSWSGPGSGFRYPTKAEIVESMSKANLARIKKTWEWRDPLVYAGLVRRRMVEKASHGHGFVVKQGTGRKPQPKSPSRPKPAAASRFKKGDAVYFDHPARGRIKGKVKRTNVKTVSITVGPRSWWRVPYSKLRLA